MVDDSPDDAQAPELIRPYVKAPGRRPPRRDSHMLPPRRPLVVRDPGDDPTVVIPRDDVIAADPPAPGGPGHRRARRVSVPAVVAVGVVAAGLGVYLIWPSGAHPGAAAPAAGVAASSAPPATARATSTASAPEALPRPVATHPETASPTPSTGARTPSPSTVRTFNAVPTGPTSPPAPPPPPTPGPIIGTAGMCMDNNGAIAGNGNRIQLYDCNGTVAQIWIFEPDGTLRVQGKCLRAATLTPGALTDLWDCDGGPGQVWRAASGDTLVNVASGLCLDVAGSGTGDGTPLDVAMCNGTDRQRWKLP